MKPDVVNGCLGPRGGLVQEFPVSQKRCVLLLKNYTTQAVTGPIKPYTKKGPSIKLLPLEFRENLFLGHGDEFSRFISSLG